MKKWLLIPVLLMSCAPLLRPVDPSRLVDGARAPQNQINQNLMLQLVNQARANGTKCGAQWMKPVAPLRWNGALQKSAQGHADFMAANNYFSHDAYFASDAGDRASKAGYAWHIVGENIAMGQRDEREVMQGWLRSPGHCQNIMEGRFVEIGVAVNRSVSDTTFWAMELGAP